MTIGLLGSKPLWKPTNHPLNRGLVAWWLSPSFTPRLMDIAGRNHGTLTNGPVWSRNKTRTGGYAGLIYDATDDFVLVPDNAALKGMAQLTISFWCYARTGGGNSFGRVIAKNDQADYGILCFNETNFQGSIGATACDTAVADISGLRSHVAMTYDGANIRMYWQGIRSGTATALTGAVPSTTNALYIGNRADTARGFDGWISDVRIQNVALSADEVFALYTKSRSGYGGLISHTQISRPFSVASAGTVPTPYYYRQFVGGGQ